MTGGCLCGGVRFELEPPLRDVVVCHCSLCRRSGTLAGAYTAVSREALRLVVQETLTWYVDVNGRRRGFCGGCGATLFWSDDERGDDLGLGGRARRSDRARRRPRRGRSI